MTSRIYKTKLGFFLNGKKNQRKINELKIIKMSSKIHHNPTERKAK